MINSVFFAIDIFASERRFGGFQPTNTELFGGKLVVVNHVIPSVIWIKKRNNRHSKLKRKFVERLFIGKKTTFAHELHVADMEFQFYFRATPVPRAYLTRE